MNEMNEEHIKLCIEYRGGLNEKHCDCIGLI